MPPIPTSTNPPVEPTATEASTLAVTETPTQTLVDLPMNFSSCQVDSEYWSLMLYLPVQQMPSALTLTFTNRATTSVFWSGSTAWNGSSYQSDYSATSNAGQTLASVTALLPIGISGSVDIRWAGNCTSVSPQTPTWTATASPTATETQIATPTSTAPVAPPVAPSSGSFPPAPNYPCADGCKTAGIRWSASHKTAR